MWLDYTDCQKNLEFSMFMNLQILLFGAAVFTAALIWVLFGFAERWGLVDRADSDRKIHVGAIPLIGGLAVFICLLLFQLFAPSFPRAISVAMFILVVVGITDDRSNVEAVTKLLFQCLAVGVIIVGANVKIVSLGTLPNGTELLLGYFSIPITLICAVCLINAINMIDGIDGLAAGLSILALTYLFFAARIIGLPLDAQTLSAMVVLVGALLGFLIFNFNWIAGKKIFLGDAGTMILGLFLSYLLIETSQRPPLTSALPASIIPWVVAVPVLDIAAVSTRRMLAGGSPMRADRTHLHHRLLDMGFSTRQTLAFILVLSLILFVIGMLLTQFGGLHAGIGFLCLLPLYAITYSKMPMPRRAP
jgi:UDP-GlcNAc:undecaprenyl-phosphate GlcNAc-1-phosphate transferase